jgi:hypothetical protein
MLSNKQNAEANSNQKTLKAHLFKRPESEGIRESIHGQSHVITAHLRLITKFEYALGALSRAVPSYLALCHGERVRYTVNYAAATGTTRLWTGT